MAKQKLEPAAPGAAGLLKASAQVDGHDVGVHGAYFYVGKLHNGMLAFAMAEPIYLHAHEVHSFSRRGASR